jgi:type I restriction enzyme S subunit
MRDGWIKTNVGSAFHIQQGKTLAISKLMGGKYPVYGANGIVGYFDEFNFDFPVTGLGCRGSCGTIYYIENKAFLANNVMAIWEKDASQIDSRYIPLALGNVDLIASGAISGQVQPQITKQSLEPVPIAIPPLPEQKRIVDLISSVDSYIGALQQQLESAKRSRSAVLHKIFHLDRSNWKIQKLEECTQKISDGSHNPPKGIEHSEFLMLSSKDVWDGYLTNLDPRFLKQSDFELENKRTQVESGDVLLTVVGTIGRCAVYQGNPKNVTFQRSVCVIKATKDILNESFLMMYLQSIQPYLDQNARGVAQRGIYLNQIRDLEIPIPTLNEQFAIVSNIEVLDNFIQATQRVVAQIQKLRAVILSDLLSGEHEIPDSYDKVMGAA